MKYFRTTLVVLLLGALAVGSLILGLDSSATSPLVEDQPETEITVTPQSTETVDPQPVRLALSWSPESGLLWPTATGTVTAVHVAPGDTISNGTVVAAIDRVGVIALATPTPPHRDLKPGDSGEDVVQLANALVEFGFLSADDVSDRYNSNISKAMRQLNFIRAVDSNRFSVSHVIWLPEPMVLGSIDLARGAPAPDVASTALKQIRMVEQASVVSVDDGPNGTPLPASFSREGSRVVTVDGRQFDVVGDGVVSDPESLGDGRTPEDTTVSGVIAELAQPIVAVDVPASAVLTGSEGRFCVVNADGSILAVEVVDGRAGRTSISPTPNGEIVVNPVESRIATTCSA